MRLQILTVISLSGPVFTRAISSAITLLALLSAGTHSDAFAQTTGATPFEVRAHLSPRNFTTLSSEMDGKIDSLTVREGDRVKRGRTLVKFNCRVETAKAQKAEPLAKQTTKVATAYARLYTLKAKSELEVAEAKSNAAAAKAEAVVMSEMLKRCTISAPFSGRVFELHVRRYQYVATGKPLIGLLDDKDLELELIVPSNWLTWLKLGAEFSVRIEELAKSYPATVTAIGARVDPVSQSIKLKAGIIGAHTELMAGMGGRAIFLVPKPRADIERQK